MSIKSWTHLEVNQNPLATFQKYYLWTLLQWSKDFNMLAFGNISDQILAIFYLKNKIKIYKELELHN